MSELCPQWYALPGVLVVISALFFEDILSFFPQAFGQQDGAGTALYLSGGLFEVNDRIHYSAAADYFWGLCAAAVVSVFLTAASILLVRHLIRKAR